MANLNTVVFFALLTTGLARKAALSSRHWGTNIHFTSGQPGEVAQIGVGFRIVRMDFSWGRTEQVKGQYNFSAYETLYNEQVAVGIRSYWILDYGNAIYTGSSMTAPSTPEQQDAFAAWAVAAMLHFQGRNVTWELWNEPNIPGASHDLGGWYPYANATAYMDLYDRWMAAVSQHSELQSETLVAPASAGIPDDFLEACFARGMLKTIDAVSLHPYRRTYPETVIQEYASVRALMAKYNPDKRDVAILSGEWGYSTCSFPNGTSMDCVKGAQTGNNTYDDQAKELARQWLVNAMEDIPISIFYDWSDGGSNKTYGEDNFGVVENIYHNSSLPRTPKPSYHAATTLQSRFGERAFVQRVPVAVGANASDTDAYALVFEGNHAAVWKVDGDTACSPSQRQYTDCGFSGISEKECLSRGCCYWPNQHTRPWCAFPGVTNTTGAVAFALPDTSVTSLDRVDMYNNPLPSVQRDAADEKFHLVADDTPQYLFPASG
eukprot:m.85899 g.85899  ORF g.85899 m.85899 type:complete len:491 (+) comp14748_c0_seq1:3-1475(+)